MRKVLLFLLVFGLGLAVLVFLGRRSKDAPDSGDPSTAAQQGETPEGIPPEAADATGQEGIQVILRGEVEITPWDDQGRPLYHFKANLEPKPGGLYDARNIHVDLFDPDRAARRCVFPGKWSCQ